MSKNKVLLFVAGIILTAGFLYPVFSGRLILSQTVSVGPIILHYYGLIIAFAVIGAYFLARKRAKEYQIDLKLVEDLVFWVIICGFIGARLYHVLSSYSYYFRYPLEIFQVWHGGLSIYGAVLGGLFVLWIYKKIYPLPFTLYAILDWLTPSLLLGQIIGRFGNLFNYELYGYPTNFPWKMFVPEQFRLGIYQNVNFFHPLFLYEALANLFILLFLLKIKKNKPFGHLFFSYVLLYNIVRFALEFLRIDAVLIGNLRQNAVLSLLLVLISAFWLIKHRYGKIS
jgi:phosphatidylglycerol:prolipoprotein diacylglycerol transferase